ncbi:heavy-metal-associated domain-containing protein [Novosphingobium rosa]|uniref:heavy-metal-associated domain-containing protein n=1 Tax=Novosphingobium rosa TaxID=76978 RepID=UPI000AB0AF57|nr:heavy-metal-associated domain-containing protein [Novosphingobium rosa]
MQTLFPREALLEPLRRMVRGRPRMALAGAGVLALAGGIVAFGPSRLIAQIEGDRGIAPVVTTGDIEINGIQVDVQGKTAQEARQAGWHEAYKQAWAKAGGPEMGADAIGNLVSAVVVESEQIGPHRYRATLGIVFDRGKASGFLAGHGPSGGMRSAPMLVVPVLYSGGVGQVYEVRGIWQKAWAEYHTGASAIDYIRPQGSGSDSLLLTAGQPGRRSRIWWRALLDRFGASNVLIPEARLERQWPGGPVKGTFTARIGPDNTLVDSFSLSVQDEGQVPGMLNQAVLRFDQIYTQAMTSGQLRSDPTLNVDHPVIDPGLAQLIRTGEAAEAEQAAARARAEADALAAQAQPTPAPTPEPKPAAAAAALSVQFASPDAGAVDAALGGVRGTKGVEGAATTSIAIGGTSVMRVTFNGTAAELAAALRSRGWQVSVAGNTLRIHR